MNTNAGTHTGGCVFKLQPHISHTPTPSMVVVVVEDKQVWKYANTRNTLHRDSRLSLHVKEVLLMFYEGGGIDSEGNRRGRCGEDGGVLRRNRYI